jgi:hypothetical protein
LIQGVFQVNISCWLGTAMTGLLEGNLLLVHLVLQLHMFLLILSQLLL